MPIGIEISFPLLGVFLAATGETLREQGQISGDESGAEAYIASTGDKTKFDTFLCLLSYRESWMFSTGYLKNPHVRRI